ncbi:MAG TPA: type II toxin-antitoxin system HicB family antitoxin [Candidatus Acidoferrales bacterium]|nr:type II toxin-antitoxin system HicB family antitoxin [Candidatus Acidoferrales bacterium]
MAAITRTYSVLLDPDPHGGFTVTVPLLPGCITQAEGVEDCLERAREAIAVYLEDLAATGEPVPEEAVPPQLRRVSVSVDRLGD